jgi:hypothetical protein
MNTNWSKEILIYFLESKLNHFQFNKNYYSQISEEVIQSKTNLIKKLQS